MGSKIQEIFKDHWEGFLEQPNIKVRKVVKEDVSRIIDCGDIKKGYMVYSCPKCLKEKKVGFSCKSRFCTSCGKVYVDDRANAMSKKLIKVTHRHMVFTIPSELREYFRRDRKLLSILPKLAYEVIKLYFHKRNKKEEFTPGVVSVIHTFGGDLKWNPHVHLLVTEGGVGKISEWKSERYFHYGRLRKSWQKALLSGLEKEINKGKREYNYLKNKLYALYQEGFYVYGERRIKNGKGSIKYVGRYTGRPAIADSRIISYDGETVTYHYRDKKTKEKIIIEESAYEFIKKVIIHIAERGFKMIRYYGIYSNKGKRKCKVVKMLDEKIEEMYEKMRSWRKRIQLSFSHDPLECEECGSQMRLSDIYYPGLGSVIDLIRAKEYAKIEKEIEGIKRIDKVVGKYLSTRPMYI